MSSYEELGDRLDRIEDRAADRPGEALDDLETLVGELSAGLADGQTDAEALVRNEDLSGAAQRLGENALLLQRTAVVALELREQIRRRR